jgi:ferredoxin-nitrite reductase
MADWGPEKFKEKLIEYTGELPSRGTDLTKDWNAGYFYGVNKQKQEGLNYVGFSVPVGRLTAQEVFEIAEISKKYGNGELRTCNSQNFIIPNVPDEHVDALLAEQIFGDTITISPKKITAHAVSCTGTEYCNLAITETKERMKRVAAYLDDQVELDVPVRMHMVGCPNSCGQRQIADIGFQGVKTKTADKKMVEAFELYVGGTLNDGGKFNEKLNGKVVAEDLHHVTKDFLDYFKENKLMGESFFDFQNRVGIEALQGTLDTILENVTAKAN